eukprot:9683358-Lingulodinium_polyedra.AAC.1
MPWSTPRATGASDRARRMRQARSSLHVRQTTRELSSQTAQGSWSASAPTPRPPPLPASSSG